MARPIKRRSVKSYARDIESLGRLRTAILIDREVNPEIAKKVMGQLDALAHTLSEISDLVKAKAELKATG